MTFPRAWKRLAADQSGATAVEYALIIAAIAGAIIAIVYTFGGKVKTNYQKVESHMP